MPERETNKARDYRPMRNGIPSKDPSRETKPRFKYKSLAIVLPVGLGNKIETCYQLMRKIIEEVADRILHSKVSANVSPPRLHIIITWGKLK